MPLALPATRTIHSVGPHVLLVEGAELRLSVAPCQLQFAHQPDGLGDQRRISARNQSPSMRTSTSGRSPGG